MSDRERWIVYPLLFMTLGMTFRDKIIPPKQLWARSVVVVNEDEKPLVAIDSSKEGGVIRLIREDQSLNLVLGHEGSSSSLFVETPTDRGAVLHPVVGNLRRFAPNQPDH
ncbi:MAG TPA: hypothetical protein VGY55_16500 [Pirellulales bacterium]|jgi:hypothetical protein|nr:hypothetical protein [Pirellulales bacterium]